MQTQSTEPLLPVSPSSAGQPVDKLSDVWFSQVHSELCRLRAVLIEPPRNATELKSADEAMDRLQTLAEELAERQAVTIEQLRTKTLLLRDILDEEACSLAHELVLSMCRDIDALI